MSKKFREKHKGDTFKMPMPARQVAGITNVTIRKAENGLLVEYSDNKDFRTKTIVANDVQEAAGHASALLNNKKK